MSYYLIWKEILFYDKINFSIISLIKLYSKSTLVEFLSMAPDYTKDMNRVLNNELNSSKVFDVLLSITKEIDKQYSNTGNRPWLYGEEHETRAYSYGNFILYLKNMVARWLRALIPMEDIINDFEI